MEMDGERRCCWESGDNAEEEEDKEEALPPPPPPPLSASSSEAMQSEAMALVQVWMLSSCSSLTPPPSLSCDEGWGGVDSLSLSPPLAAPPPRTPLSVKEVK